jgi:hypothetical protein
MKAYGGVDVQIHIFLDLGTSWTRTRLKCPHYPSYRGLGRPRSRSGRCEVHKNLLPLNRNRTPAIQPVARRYTD